MNVAIIGGAGYIGSVLTHMMCGHHDESGRHTFNIRVYDSLKFSQTPLLACASFSNFQFFRWDFGDARYMDRVIDWANVVIPLAAVVGAPACRANTEEANRINVQAIKRLIRGPLSKRPDTKVIFPNTNSGYGTSGEEYCTEESPLKPLSHYARTKLIGEQIVLERDNSTVFRIATVFGASPRMRWDLLVNDFARRAYTEQHICVFDGAARRNFISVQDVARAFCWAVLKPDMSIGVFNLGNDSINLTKLQLAHSVREHFPACSVIESEFGDDPDQRDYVVSSDKLKAAGFAAHDSLEEGYISLTKALRMWPHGNGANA